MATSFRKDRNFEGGIRQQAEFQAAMRATAAVVKESVDAAAPDRTGYYKRSLKVVGTSVVSTDPFAHLVEWGSRNNPPYAPMRRGVLALGLRFDPSPL